MSMLAWNPICDSLLHYLLEKRCPALAKQFKDLFYPKRIDVTNDDLTHLVDYFSKPPKKRGLSKEVDEPRRKKIKSETPTANHDECEIITDRTVQPNQTTEEVPSQVLESKDGSSSTAKVSSQSVESSSEAVESEDDAPVIVTPVKKPPAPIVDLSSGSSSSDSSSDSDTEDEDPTKIAGDQTQTSPNSSSAAAYRNFVELGSCDVLLSPRHTCQASPKPTTSSHQGSSDAQVQKSNSFFDRLMGNSSFRQVTPNSVISPASRPQSTPTSTISPASLPQSTPKSTISPASCLQSTPNSVISPINSRLTPQSTSKSVISPASRPQSTPTSVISPSSRPQSTPKSAIPPASRPQTASGISPSDRQPAPQSKSTSPSQPTPVCKYGMNCRRRLAGDCQFLHTYIRKEREVPRVGPGGRRICRFGADCRRMLQCNFEHIL